MLTISARIRTLHVGRWYALLGLLLSCIQSMVYAVEAEVCHSDDTAYYAGARPQTFVCRFGHRTQVC